MKLGKLEKVKDLRSVWPHEANDFTKLLVKKEPDYCITRKINC